jgi:Putative transposase
MTCASASSHQRPSPGTGRVLPHRLHATRADRRNRLVQQAVEIAATTLHTIAADPRYLGAQIGATLVLHTWGSASKHRPHVHRIVSGGGLSPDGERWIACRPGFFLPMRVLSRLFCRCFLEALTQAHRCSRLQFFSEYAGLADPAVFARWLAPLHTCEWVVYAKRPFAGSEAVLSYLFRYTHRVAISGQRLLAFDERGVTFRWKDYREKALTRHKTMTLEGGEFMRRFLLHVLPGGFHRIRHYGLLANPVRRASLAKVRALLHVAAELNASPEESLVETRTAFICRHCGAPKIITDILARTAPIRAPPTRRGET